MGDSSCARCSERLALERRLTDLEREAELVRSQLHDAGPCVDLDPALFASVARARRLYAERRLRERRLGFSDLLREPVWDMLLDLYVSHHEGRRVAVGSACIAARVSQSTGLRMIERMERRGLVARVGDPDDARRRFVELASPTLERLRLALEA